MKLLVSLAMSLLAVIFVVVGILRNRKSHPAFAITRVAVIAVSAALSVFLTNLLSGILAKFLFSMARISPLVLKEMMIKVPTLSEAVLALLSSVLALLLFFLIFVILRGILSAICRPILRRALAQGKPAPEPDLLESLDEMERDRKFREKLERGELDEYEISEEAKRREREQKQRKKLWRKSLLRTDETSIVSVIGGAVCGLMLFVVSLAPIVGVLTMTGDALSALITEKDTDEVYVLVEEISDAAANNVGSKAVSVLGGQQIFDGLTTYRVGDRKVTLREEVRFLTQAGVSARALTDDSMPAQDRANTLRATGRAFRETSLIPVVLPQFCHTASADWDAGRSFCGIQKPTFGANVSKIAEPVIDLLASSTYDTVKEDVYMLLEMGAVAVEREAMDRFSEDRLLVLEDENLTSALLKPLLGNVRMRPIADAVLKLGVQTVGGVLKMHENGADLYDAWSEDMILATSEISYENDNQYVEDLSARYEDVFANYVLTTAPSSPKLLAQSVLSVTKLSGAPDEEVLKVIFSQTVLTDSMGNSVCLTADTMVGLSNLMVWSDIQLNSDLTNSDYEANALAKAMKDAASTARSMDGFEVAVMVRKVGPILDDLAATETVGAKNTERILVAMMQWEKVCSALGVDQSEATELAESIVENAQKKGYAALMASLGDTVEALQAAEDESVSMEERVEVLMENMTPESAKVLQNLAKPGVMIANGVPEDNAESSAKLMSTMFGNLADMGEEMSDADYQRESKAVTKVTNLAMNAGKTAGQGTFGEGSATGVSAEEYVNEILDSSVVSKTARDVVYENAENPTKDPLNMGEELTAEEEAEMLAALNARWANETDRENEEVRQSYVATAAMVNMTIVITDTGIIPASN